MKKHWHLHRMPIMGVLSASIALVCTTLFAVEASRLPGEVARPQDLQQCRAGAKGPCNAGAACTGTGVACALLPDGGGCANTTDSCGGPCAGPANESCGNTNEVNCAINNVACCSTGRKCVLGAGCNCNVGVGADVGTRPDC